MTKRCSQCRETKPVAAFHRAGEGYRSECKRCASESHRRYREANPQKVKAARARWRERNRQHTRDYAKEWATRNPERKREKDREWSRSNPEWKRAYDNHRRALLGGPPSTESVEYIAILRADRCAYCGNEAGHVDHIEPIVSGGANDWPNFTASCKSCNSSKHATPLLIFLAGVRDARGAAASRPAETFGRRA